MNKSQEGHMARRVETVRDIYFASVMFTDVSCSTFIFLMASIFEMTFFTFANTEVS